MPATVLKPKLKQTTPVKKVAPAKVEPTPQQVTEEQLLTALLNNPDGLSDEDVVDLYGTLSDKVEAIMQAPEFSQLKLATDALKKRLEKFPAEAPVTINGKHWMVEAGACTKEPRKVTDVVKVMEFIGTEAFAAIAKVGVSDAEKYLSPEQFAEVCPDTTGYTTNRKLTKKFLG